MASVVVSDAADVVAAADAIVANAFVAAADVVASVAVSFKTTKNPRIPS